MSYYWLGFILHHKKESEDWDELRLTDTKSYTHEWLKCGSRYQYYLIAFNSVGKSDASSIVSAKTDGTCKTYTTHTNTIFSYKLLSSLNSFNNIFYSFVSHLWYIVHQKLNWFDKSLNIWVNCFINFIKNNFELIF